MGIESSLLVNHPAARPDAVAFDKLQKQMGSPGGQTDGELREAARDFEAMLVTQMLQIMRQSVPDGGLFEQDSGRDTYFQMLDMELGRQVARTGSMGLADALYRQLNLRTPSAPEDKQTP